MNPQPQPEPGPELLATVLARLDQHLRSVHARTTDPRPEQEDTPR